MLPVWAAIAIVTFYYKMREMPEDASQWMSFVGCVTDDVHVINEGEAVVLENTIGSNGVIHEINNVLIPDLIKLWRVHTTSYSYN